MSAELIVVAGPLLGERFPLGPSELKIGRSPSSQVRLDEPGAAWDHCILRPHDGGWRVVDCHTGGGTFVNGMRVREQALEPGDQINIGETIFAYRDNAAAPDSAPAEPALLRACSLLFLFRALAMSRNDRQRAMLEAQIVALIGDLVPSCGGAVRLGGELPELPETSVVLPLHVRGEVVGRLAASFPPAESANLQDHRDTLSAVATLAAAALENARDFELLRNENELLVLGCGNQGGSGLPFYSRRARSRSTARSACRSGSVRHRRRT